MSHNNFASPLRLDIVPSKTLIITIVMLHIGAMMSLAAISLAWLFKLIPGAFICLSLWAFLSLNAKAPGPGIFSIQFPRIRGAVWRNDHAWSLTTEDGAELKAQLLATSFVNPRITIVNLKVSGKPWYSRYRSLIFMQDNLDEEIFRRLRIRLRWYSMPEQDNLEALK